MKSFVSLKNTKEKGSVVSFALVSLLLLSTVGVVVVLSLLFVRELAIKEKLNQVLRVAEGKIGLWINDPSSSAYREELSRLISEAAETRLPGGEGGGGVIPATMLNYGNGTKAWFAFLPPGECATLDNGRILCNSHMCSLPEIPRARERSLCYACSTDNSSAKLRMFNCNAIPSGWGICEKGEDESNIDSARGRSSRNARAFSPHFCARETSSDSFLAQVEEFPTEVAAVIETNLFGGFFKVERKVMVQGYPRVLNQEIVAAQVPTPVCGVWAPENACPVPPLCGDPTLTYQVPITWTCSTPALGCRDPNNPNGLCGPSPVGSLTCPYQLCVTYNCVDDICPPGTTGTAQMCHRYENGVDVGFAPNANCNGGAGCPVACALTAVTHECVDTSCPSGTTGSNSECHRFEDGIDRGAAADNLCNAGAGCPSNCSASTCTPWEPVYSCRPACDVTKGQSVTWRCLGGRPCCSPRPADIADNGDGTCVGPACADCVFAVNNARNPGSMVDVDIYTRIPQCLRDIVENDLDCHSNWGQFGGYEYHHCQKREDGSGVDVTPEVLAHAIGDTTFSLSICRVHVGINGTGSNVSLRALSYTNCPSSCRFVDNDMYGDVTNCGCTYMSYEDHQWDQRLLYCPDYQGFVDASCNFVSRDTAPPGMLICGYVGANFTPLSLIWGDGAEIEASGPVVKFSLNPQDPALSYSVWRASAEAPLLVYDPKHRGVVSSAEELFGNYAFGGKTISLHKSLTGQTARAGKIPWENGYEALSLLDADNNGKVSGGELADLALWFDRNRNAISEPGEVVAVSELGIKAIYTKHERRDEATGDLMATIGYEREVDGQIVKGSTVDWYAESYASVQEAALSQIEVDRGSEEVGPAENRLEENQEKEGEISAKSSLGAHLGGIWVWNIIEKGGEKRPGLFGITDHGKAITGWSVSEVRLDKNKNEYAAAVIYSPLNGKKKLLSDGTLEVEMEVTSSTTSSVAKSIVKISKDGTKMKAVTEQSFRKSSFETSAYSSPEPVKYEWEAKRFKSKRKS